MLFSPDKKALKEIHDLIMRQVPEKISQEEADRIYADLSRGLHEKASVGRSGFFSILLMLGSLVLLFGGLVFFAVGLIALQGIGGRSEVWQTIGMSLLLVFLALYAYLSSKRVYQSSLAKLRLSTAESIAAIARHGNKG